MIVIPMAGLSQRFFDAGYVDPKYMLLVGDDFVFDLSVLTFQRYFETDEFLFICRDVQETPAFVEARCKALGIARYKIVTLSAPTEGQAVTVEVGLEKGGCSPEAELLIFNIDTIRPDFQRPWTRDASPFEGYLETFQGEGDGWSFVLPLEGSEHGVARTTEKVRISDYCSTGLYQFNSAALFLEALATERRSPAQDLPEFYVAPLYNHLISRGHSIGYVNIRPEEVTFCGTPAEYEVLLRAASP